MIIFHKSELRLSTSCGLTSGDNFDFCRIRCIVEKDQAAFSRCRPDDRFKSLRRFRTRAR